MLCQSTPRWAQVRLNPPISCLTLFGSPVPPLSFPSLSLVLQNRRNFPCPGGQWEPIPAGLGCHQGAAPRTPGPIWEFQFISTQEVNDAQSPRNSSEFLWPCLKGCETWWNFFNLLSFLSLRFWFPQSTWDVRFGITDVTKYLFSPISPVLPVLFSCVQVSHSLLGISY